MTLLDRPELRAALAEGAARQHLRWKYLPETSPTASRKLIVRSRTTEGDALLADLADTFGHVIWFAGRWHVQRVQLRLFRAAA